MKLIESDTFRMAVEPLYQPGLLTKQVRVVSGKKGVKGEGG